MRSVKTQPLVKALLVAGGSASLALGVIGIFIPILPTTPFLLLAAVCYARSSRRCHHWLLHNRWFGTIIRDYREGRGMPRSRKILTIVALWLTIGSTAVGAVEDWWVRLALLAVACAVTIHLLRIKTRADEAARTHPDGSEAKRA